MAIYLYRLGRFAFRNRWAVLGFWIVIVILAGIAGKTLSGPTTESFSIPGIPALEALDLQQSRFASPGTAAGTTEAQPGLPATAQLVFAAPEGERLDTPDRLAAIQALLTTLTGSNQVASVQPGAAQIGPLLSGVAAAAGVAVPPGLVSADGRIAQVHVTYTVPSIDLESDARATLRTAVETAGATPGLEVEVGGDALQSAGPGGAGGGNAKELAGVVIAFVVLMVALRSIVAGIVPILTGALGVAIGVSLVTAATGFINLSGQSSILAAMLGLAVAIDYALFIFTRYRHEIRLGSAPDIAIGHAVGTAGSAVVFAGLTVIIALSGLAIVQIPFLTAMGLAAALTVAIAVLIAITLLPAIIGITGRFASGRKPGKVGPEPATKRIVMGERWGRFVTRNRWPVLIVGVAVLAVMAIPTLKLELALPSAATASTDSTERKAYDLLAEGFGAGFNGPVLVVVDAAPAADHAAAIADVGQALATLPGVASTSAAQVNAAGDTAVFQVVPVTGPSDPATADLVKSIRALAVDGAVVNVTGLPAINFDVSDRLAAALVPYMLVVVGLALLLLLLVFRSIVVPIKATVGFLLTIGATFGAVVAVFQWGWGANLIGLSGTGPIMSLVPIFMIGIVFGLAMDYQVFLVTRMREEFIHGAHPTEAVVGGVRHGARVVTAAALIMISVFTSFVIGGEQIIMSIGFAMAVGVAIDAFIVRLTIVPAFMAIVGRGGWWLPRWLDRILPNVDIEGQSLERKLGPAKGTPAPQPAE